MPDAVGSAKRAPTRAEIEAAVANAVSRTLRVPPGDVHLTSRLYEDLGLDSMGLIHVSIAVEEQLGVALSLTEAPDDELQSVQDLVTFAETRLGQSGREVSPC
jgi:acyl carrier protein